VRYGDKCFEKALSSDDSVLNNLDVCADKMSTLWSPETSNEVAFVMATFPSALYHVGIEQFVFGKGMFNSDNSFGVGVPFFTGA
jgi:hypothetical protein